MTPIIHESVTQGSAEWLKLRLGKPTASEFARFLTLKGELRDGEKIDKYMNEKLAEKMLGTALPGFGSYATEQGEMMEDEARRWFAMEYDCEPRQVGFVEAENCGCSPDALIGEDAGLEIKCPFAQTHIGYLRKGVVPADYIQQVHGSLFVSNRQRWHFLSYRRGFPKLVVTVERDEEIMGKIAAAIADFTARFQTELDRLSKL